MVENARNLRLTTLSHEKRFHARCERKRGLEKLTVMTIADRKNMYTLSLVSAFSLAKSLNRVILFIFCLLLVPRKIVPQENCTDTEDVYNETSCLLKDSLTSYQHLRERVSKGQQLKG